MRDTSEHERDRLIAQFGRRYAAGTVIFREGDIGMDVFVLHEGSVRALKRVRRVERSVQILKAGDLFGEDGLLPGAPRATTAVAITDVTVVALDLETFSALLQGSAPVAMRMLQQLVRRLRDAEEQIENMMLPDRRSRAVNALLKLAAEDGHHEGRAQLSRSPLELASRAGLDVDAVKRSILELRDGGYLRIADEQIVIEDLDALRALFALLGRAEQIRA
jgi:CRP/FNR family cyclic AMP-dependent transcriptional regulator